MIRDNPSVHFDTLACVSTRLARRRPAGPACAVSREGALPPDPAVAAAAQLGTERFHVVDLRSGLADSFRVAHGRGSDPDHSGFV